MHQPKNRSIRRAPRAAAGRRSRPSGGWRGGWQGTETAVALAVIGGTLTISAALFAPQFLRAADAPSDGTESLRPEDPYRADVIDALSMILASSKATLGLRHDAPGRLEAVALWSHDIENPDVVDPGEVLLIWHSRFLNSLTAYRRPSTDEESEPAGPFRLETIWTWPQSKGVESHPVAMEVAAWSVERVVSSKDGVQEQLVLRWVDEAADSNAEATARVALPARSP